jgi:hypothetical protein
MTALCIAGTQLSELKAVENSLLNAGMVAARPLQRQTAIDFAAWHKQVLGSDNLDRWDNGSNPPIGRLWEQVAADLFLANLEAPLWGWADVQNVALLDYWAGFDSSVKFLLICQSPEQAVLEQLIAEASHQDIEEKLAEWHGAHTAMLKFHQRQPARSTLLWADGCMQYPIGLLQHCAKRWKLKLDLAPASQSGASDAGKLISALGYYIASHYIENNAPAKQLKEELNRLAEKLQGRSESKEPKQEDLLQRLLDEYRGLQSGHFQPLSSSLGKSSMPLRAAGQGQAASLKEENLRLESKVRELQSQAEQAEQAKTALKGQLDATSATLERAQRELAEQHEAHDAITAALRQSQEENARRLAEEIQARNGLLAQRDVDVQRQTDAKARIREVAQENDLLLAQLHQVQEELEECLRQQQDARNQLLLAHARWQRMLKRNPSYSDFERIERLQVGSGPDQRNTWRVQGLTIGARIIAHLEFSTVIENGMAGLVFPKEAATSGALLRWPCPGEQGEEALILPRGDNSVIRARAATIEELSTSDAQLAWRLPALLLSQLDEKDAPLAAALKLLQETSRRMTIPLRYDEVVLKREQVNPDYEHLWFVLKNAEIHGQPKGDLEFRLACADIHGNRFGLRPKLEFPQTASTALENWYAESSDDFGLKLELRFVMPHEFDMGIWKKLCAHDQQLIKAVLRAVPRIIANLSHNGIQLKRAPESWQSIAIHMARALNSVGKPPMAEPTQVNLAGQTQTTTAPTPTPTPTPTPVMVAQASRKTKAARTAITGQTAAVAAETETPTAKAVKRKKRGIVTTA